MPPLTVGNGKNADTLSNFGLRSRLAPLSLVGVARRRKRRFHARICPRLAFRCIRRCCRGDARPPRRLSAGRHRLAGQPGMGFTILRHPWDGSTLTWGAVLGGVAVLSTAAARAAVHERRLVGASLAAFAAAFVACESSLYLVSALWLGGTENFAWAIVLRILAINAASFVGLFAAALLVASSRLEASGRATSILSR